jgi:hypothetical protein
MRTPRRTRPALAERMSVDDLPSWTADLNPLYNRKRKQV